MRTEQALYPKNWEAISYRAKGQCECRGECGKHHRPKRCRAFHMKPHPITGKPVVLECACLNHDPSDCRHENLLAMCQRCHLNMDAEEQWRRRRERRSQLWEYLLS